MNRSDLIECVASHAGISKAAARRAIESYHECLKGALKRGNKVTITGFGSFSVATRSPRMFVNPRTGEKISVKAKKVVKFKPGVDLSIKK